MKNIITTLGCVLLLASCTSNNGNIVESEFVDVTSCYKFDNSAFGAAQKLRSEILGESLIYNPVRIGFKDSLLFYVNMGAASDTLVHCINVENNQYVGGVYLRGNGPQELLSAGNIELSPDSMSFWTVDLTRQIWVGRQNIGLKDSSMQVVDLRDSLMAGIDNANWLQHKYVFNSWTNYKERFFICDTLTHSKRAFINPNLQFKDKYDKNIMADIFTTNLCVTPNRSRIILAGRYLDLIEVYDSEGKLLFMWKGPEEGFELKFNESRSVRNSRFIKSAETRRAYLAVRATDNCIYALYSGKMKKDEEHYSYSRQLYTFSLDGMPLRIYELDVPIINFTIDEKRGYIYATSINANLVRFKL